MGILDFREIERPTKNQTKGIESRDLDAFEKFAEEFFSQIIGAEIITRMRRGSDNALDLKMSHEGKVLLVSCKHYAHTDSAVGVDDEQNAFESICTNSCEGFVGFYSTSPSSGLITRLEGFKANPKTPFDYKIYKNTDIESALLDKDSAKGWLLAARYFPKSYANLFQRFVIPIDHYKTSDLKKSGHQRIELDGPYGGIFSGNHDAGKIIRAANDSLTSALHSSFFIVAVKEAIDTFPKYFGYKIGSNPNSLSLSDISPLWGEELIYTYPVDCNIPIIVCAIWSFWNPSRAQEAYLNFQKNTSSNIYKTNELVTFPGFLTIGSISKFSNGKFRDIFSRLIAFCPAHIDQYTGSDVICFEKSVGMSKDWNFANSEGLDFLAGRLFN